MAMIAVSGHMLRHPVPANVMTCLQYVLGLRLLGHEVFYVEDRASHQLDASVTDPDGLPAGGLPGAGLRTAREALRTLQADIPVVWVDTDGGLVEGMLWSEARGRLARADLLLDIGGGLTSLDERWLPDCRAFVDVDPLHSRFGRVAHASYDVIFTYAVNAGTDRRAGAGSLPWLATVPPVIPRLWQGPPPRARGREAAGPVRTIASSAPWGPIEHGAVWLGHERDDLHALRSLPEWTRQKLELALDARARETAARFARAGWTVRALGDVGSSLGAYQAFIRGARAELALARQPYVQERNGWIGDRTVCFLAAGRPAVVPDTGIGEWLETGAGLLLYEGVEQAGDALERIARNPERHWRAARSLASREFHFRSVLTHLLERALPRRLGAVA